MKFRKRPKKPPGPEMIRIGAEPKEIFADGKSRSTITVELLDKSGNPIPALVDTQVRLISTKGILENSTIKIPEGKEAEKTVLVSSRETGPVTLSVDAAGLKSLSITLNFLEKPRFCMHCGTRMLVEATSCVKCGRTPPSGVDTRTCMNCKSVIPSVAKFCSECGAGQPT
jgi:ribosomal protein L40E